METVEVTKMRGNTFYLHLERGQSHLLGKLSTINMAPSLGIS